MKHFKSLLLPAMTAAACAVISSCTQEEIVTSNPGRPIEFHLDVQSRGSDKTIANLDTIWVYADDGAETVFEATPFIKDQYGNFKSEEKIYWPDGKENINFTAFWPSPERLNSDPNAADCQPKHPAYKHVLLDLQPGYCTIKNELGKNTAHQFDLITATTTTNRANANNGISLSFSHAYAQLEFRAKCDDSAEHTVVVHSMNISPVNAFSIYSITDKKWQAFKPEGKSDTSYGVYTAPSQVTTITKDVKSLTSKTGPMFVIPQTLKLAHYGNNNPTASGGAFIKVFAKVYKDGEQIIPDPNWTDEEKESRIPKNVSRDDLNSLMNWTECAILRINISEEETIDLLPGHKYIFTIDFTNGIGYWAKQDPTNPDMPVLPNPISMVDVTIADWDSSDYDIMP